MIISVENHRSHGFELSSEERAGILQGILDHNLLAPSPGGLAKLLGLSTRSTLKRIQEGGAKQAAITNICQALDERLGLDNHSILQMGMLIQDYTYLNSLLRHETAAKDPMQVTLAFVSGDCSCFSRQFVDNHLNEIRQYAEQEPDSFFRALFYYYFKKSFTDFYVGKLTFLKRCERVILPLADRLRLLYPANRFGKDFADQLLDGVLFTNPHPTLWKCVNGGGQLLRNYAVPDIYRKLMSALILLPGTEERSYWLTDNPEQIIMTFATPAHSPRGGFYTAFGVDLFDGTIKCLGSLGLDAEGYLEASSVPDPVTKVGRYTFVNRLLSLSFNDGSNAFGVGNNWRLLNIETIPDIKALDDRIDYADIVRAMTEANGFELMEGYGVVDVVLSRNEVWLHLDSGRRLSIARTSHGFLADISPSDRVVVMRSLSDGVAFVVWSDLNCRIPLSEFEEG